MNPASVRLRRAIPFWVAGMAIAGGAIAPDGLAIVRSQVRNVAVGDQPEAVVALGGNLVAVANRAANTLSIVNASTATRVASVNRASGGTPVGLAADPTRNRLYDLDLRDRLYVRNARTRAVSREIPLPSTIAVPGPRGSRTVELTPVDVAVQTSRNRIYVTMSAGRDTAGRLVVLDGATFAVLARTTVGRAPAGIAVVASTALYVANTGSGTVSAVSGQTNNVLRTFAVGTDPDGMAFLELSADLPQIGLLVVANRGSGSISVAPIAGTAANGLVRSLTVGDQPSGVAVNASGPLARKRVYVTNRGDDTVRVLRISAGPEGLTGSGLASIETVSVRDTPIGIAVDPVSHRVVVANRGTDSASVLARFEPDLHGFDFQNLFAFPIVLDLTPSLAPAIATLVPTFLRVDLGAVPYGLCGGMAYAALDTFNAGAVRPDTGSAPPQSGLVFDYVFNRLVENLTVDDARVFLRFLGEQVKEDGALKQASLAEVPGMLPRLDEGRPVPVGLVFAGRLDPPWKNHQVLAIGHFGSDGERVLEVYDPNFPNRTMFLFTNALTLTSDRFGFDVRHRVRGYFSVLPSYAEKNPPW